MWRRTVLLIYLVAPVPPHGFRHSVNYRWTKEWMNEWMNETSSLCADREFYNKAARCVFHFTYFIFCNEFIWPTAFWQIDPQHANWKTGICVRICDSMAWLSGDQRACSCQDSRSYRENGFSWRLHLSSSWPTLPLCVTSFLEPAGNNSDGNHSFFFFLWVNLFFMIFLYHLGICFLGWEVKKLKVTQWWMGPCLAILQVGGICWHPICVCDSTQRPGNDKCPA